MVRALEAFHANQLPMIRFDPYPCDQNVIGWQWRDSLQDPNSPNRGNQMVARCPNGGLGGYNSTYGWVCPVSTGRYLKNLGNCPDCPVGNPINPGYGNKLQRELDYVGPGPFPLRFERVNNNLYAPNTYVWTDRAGLSRNWTHTYYRRLTLGGPTEGSVMLVSADRPDGRIFPFARSGSVFITDQDVVLRLEQTTDGWRLTNEADEVETYDAQGRLLSISNKSGLTQTLNYSADGTLASVTDPFGRTLTFQYDFQLRIHSITDPDGGQYTYTYANNAITGDRPTLVKVTYPDTKERVYHHENGSYPEALTGITDENNSRFSTYAYSNGQAISSQHAGAAGRVTVSYPTSTTRTVTTYVTDTVSASRTYTYQEVLGVMLNTSISLPACPACGPAARTYDANGNVASSTDWNGNRTNYTYDLSRNLETSRTEALTSGGATTPQTRKISTQWHANYRLPTKVAEPLRITTNVYGAPNDPNPGNRGNLLSKTIQATSDLDGMQGFSATLVGTPRAWTYTYNANGQVLTVDGPRTDVSDVTTYTYYANDDPDLGKRGNVATITNAAGHVTNVTAYNAHGQPLTIVDPNGLTTTLAYDARQRLRTRTVGTETTTYDYDNAGQLTKVTLPDGSFISYSYDAAHRLTGIQDNLGNRAAYTLDLAGNRTREQVFDPLNALAQTRSRVYSSLNRLFQELGATNQTTEYGYDNQGNVTSVKDPLNHITSNQYDALNRLKQVTDPALGVAQYAYNGLDALTSVTDPRTLVTGYTVDGLGNLTQQASPDTGNTVNTYDAAGNLLTQTDAKGQVTSYSYDALNRVSLITFHDGSKQSYAYDLGANALGRLSSITETDPANQQTSLTQYAYDQHGRVTSETRTVNAAAYAVGYSYDSSGRLSGLTYPSGRTVTYAFDALGRVNQVSTTKDAQSQVVVQNVAYQPFGGVKSFTLGNGQIYSRTMDLDGRIASYTLGATNYAITFDDANRITGIGANTYGYDDVDRLTSALLPSSNFGYSYDPVGNRLSKTTGAATDTYAYSSSSNRITSITPASGPVKNFVFDPNGSTTDDALNTYAYDTRGRLVQATSAIGATTYQVNALGQRIRKTNSQGDTVFQYDTRGRLIAETDPGGTLKREYLYLGDIPVGVVQ